MDPQEPHPNRFPEGSIRQGWWKEEYFLTRDAAHAQARCSGGSI